MPGLDPLYLAYLSLTCALVVTPGATTAVVVRHTLANGWRGGLWAGIGAAVGNSTHAAAAGLGLAVLLTRSPRAFMAIQIAGGLYLSWLAIQSLRRIIRHDAVSASNAILTATRPSGARHAWRDGVWVNVLNPAIATFYLAVVPSFVPPGSPRSHYLLLAATHVIMAFAMHTVWAVALDRLKHMLARPAARMTLEVITAAALLLLAGRVLFAALGVSAGSR